MRRCRPGRDLRETAETGAKQQTLREFALNAQNGAQWGDFGKTRPQDPKNMIHALPIRKIAAIEHFRSEKCSAPFDRGECFPDEGMQLSANFERRSLCHARAC